MVVDLKLRVSYVHGSAHSSVFWPKYITSSHWRRKEVCSDFSLPINI